MSRGARERHSDAALADSRSEVSAKTRQKIELGLPNERALNRGDQGDGASEKNSADRDTDRQQSSESELFLEDDLAPPQLDPGLLGSFEVTPAQATGKNLFDFEQLHKQRQLFKEELERKRTFTQMRTQALTPFETLFTKKSCIDYLKQAQEYLFDEEVRARKTPAGFARPKQAGTRSVVLTKQRRPNLVPTEALDQHQQSPFGRTGTRRLDSADNEGNVDIAPVVDYSRAANQVS